MAIQSKSKIINGQQYQVVQFPAMFGLRLAVSLVKIVGPSLAAALSGEGVKDLASLKDAASILDKDIDFSAIVNSLVDKLDETSTTDIISRMVSMSHRNMSDLSDEAVFNNSFAANYGELLSLLAFVLEVNYGGFFEAVVAGTTGDPKATADETTENSPGS